MCVCVCVCARARVCVCVCVKLVWFLLIVTCLQVGMFLLMAIFVQKRILPVNCDVCAGRNSSVDRYLCTTGMVPVDSHVFAGKFSSC